jgi:DNA-binding response OmpR family regulator
MVPRTVLVADDDARVVESVRHALAREGYLVATAHDGLEVLSQVRLLRPDIVVLNLVLPNVESGELWRRVQSERHVPVILLTAQDDTSGQIAGLELGADDCVAKPVNPRELVARVKAVLRRAGPRPVPGTPVVVADVRIDPARCEVSVAGRPVRLRPQEFALLLLLARSGGRVLSREALLRHAWGNDVGGATRTVDKHVCALRAKLRASAVRIETVHGRGYKLVLRAK